MSSEADQEERFSEMLDFWRGLPVAEGAKVPAKSAIDPTRLIKILPHTIIAERHDRYELRLRLSGTAVDEGFGENLTGRNLFDLYPIADREFYADYFTGIVETPCGTRLLRKFANRHARELCANGIFLPLTDDAGRCRFLIGLVKFKRDQVGEPDAPDFDFSTGQVLSLEYLDLGFGIPDDAAQPAALKKNIKR